MTILTEETLTQLNDAEQRLVSQTTQVQAVRSPGS